MHRRISLLVLGVILFFAIMVRIGGLATDWRQGIYDWHPDAPRYFAQERNYIQRNYHPIAEGPLYTGNPYANILFLSWIWHGLHSVVNFSGKKELSKDSFTLSKIGRLFYIVLSCLTILILYLFTLKAFGRFDVALLSAFFFAASPLAIGLIHTIKPEVPLTFFLTLSACFAFLVSENDSFLFYLLTGLFAGIATAMKYNGVIVLVYIFAMHGFHVFKRRGEVSKSKFFLTTFFSPFLWIALLAWALFFYATEPILWHNLKEGLEYIQGYLRVARYVGVPREVAIHPFSHFLFTLSKFPENFLLFLRCLPPPLFVPILLSPFVVPKKHRSILLRILLFPSVIVGVLFLTKSLFGEEYLLHPLPFLYIGASAGTIGLYERLAHSLPKPVKKVSGLLFFSLIVFYGLFIGFREARYFRLGNIRSYAKEWADKNLPDKCIKTMLYTIPLRHDICKRQRAHVFVVPSEKTYKKHFHLPPGSILLKTFAFEKNKPLLHHLRGHHLRFYARKGKMFSDRPTIPLLPTPHRHSKQTMITRFVNGIDFDPGHYTFALEPEVTYRFLFVTRQKIPHVLLRVVNANVLNSLEIDGKQLAKTLLPFEEKAIQVPVTPSFPWQSPYLYTFSAQAKHDLLLKATFPTLSQLPRPSLSPLERYVNRQLTSSTGSLIPTSQKEFPSFFNQLFHYDYGFFTPLLKTEIPMESMEKITETTDFYTPAHSGDFCLFFREPLHLERGRYLCDITAGLCLSENSRVRFKVITPGITRAERTITYASYKASMNSGGCSSEFRIRIPFSVPAGSLVHLLVESTGKCRIFMRKVVFQTDDRTMVKSALSHILLHRFLTTPKRSFVPLLKTLDPDLCEPETIYKTAAKLKKLGDSKEAIRWLVAATHKDPVNRKYLELLFNLYKKTQDEPHARTIKKALSKLAGSLFGPWRFETGILLEAADIADHYPGDTHLQIPLYMKFPNLSGEQAVSLLFTKDKKPFKEFAVPALHSRPLGELYKITVPFSLPKGTYRIYFMVKIPRTGYTYKVMGSEAIKNDRKVFLKEVTIR